MHCPPNSPPVFKRETCGHINRYTVCNFSSCLLWECESRCKTTGKQINMTMFCSNKTLLTDSMIWIWCNFGIKYYSFYFFQTFKKVKIIPSFWSLHKQARLVWDGSHCFSAPTLGSGVSQMALVVKNLPANAGDIRDVGSVPGLGRSPGGGHDNPLQYSCLENPHGWKIVAGYSS